jgi:hypothetical protein
MACNTAESPRVFVVHDAAKTIFGRRASVRVGWPKTDLEARGYVCAKQFIEWRAPYPLEQVPEQDEPKVAVDAGGPRDSLELFPPNALENLTLSTLSERLPGRKPGRVA